MFVAVFAFLSLSAEAFALSLALAMGVLAVSTDAVSTLAVIHQFRAKGPLTDTLLGVVALDDAVGIICFSVLLAFLANADFSGIIADAAMEIGGAIATGALAAWALSRVSAYFGESTARLPLILSCVFVVVGIADTFGLAVLLAQSLRSMLFGVSPADPATLGGIAALLLTVAAGASYLPALRATRADPIAALRAE